MQDYYCGQDFVSCGKLDVLNNLMIINIKGVENLNEIISVLLYVRVGSGKFTVVCVHCIDLHVILIIIFLNLKFAISLCKIN